MVSLVSILITDIVPMHEVGSFRSYVNILATVGRGSGGAIGGLLTQWLGWRWCVSNTGRDDQRTGEC